MMILPDAIDTQIGPQQAFAFESGFFKHANGPFVARNACCLDTVETLRRKRIVYHQPRCFDHVAPASKSLPHPIADMPGLRDPVTDVAQSYSAEQFRCPVVDDEKGDRRPLREILTIAAEPLAPCRTVELVVGPAWLPRLEKRAALAAQISPLLVVGSCRRPQSDPLAIENRQVAAEERQGEHRGARR